ncbi:MAG TPA: aspartate aminotransferase family protein [Burkholderiales bacterium]|nr:aspartate aminotransferase family protein [Burkholderiales bacterium]
MNTYARQPVTFIRGEGVWLWDDAGNRYLDALAGVAVNGLGHAHPVLSAALCEQVQTLIHTSNIYQVQRQELLAERLCRISGLDKVFFCNSGCEANEAAIKLARLYGHGKGIATPTIIVMEKSFHGRTMATLTATGNRKVQAGFEPLLTGFVRVPYNDIEAVRQVAEHNHEVVAVLVEPVEGEGGIQIPDAGYLRDLRRICDANGWLLMLDEVQTGIGRTGAWFAFQHTDILPDVMTLAKGLGSGVPIGACLARGTAADLFKPGNHGSTFGGNPLACTAGLTTLQIIENDGLIGNAARTGAAIVAGFERALSGLAGVKAIRGAGMMIAIELDRPCAELVKAALAAHVLINVTAESVIRLLPPLIMNESEAAQLVDSLSPIIRDFLARKES